MSDIWAQQVLPDILELFTDKYCELVVRSDNPSKHVSLIFPCLYAIFKVYMPYSNWTMIMPEANHTSIS